MGCRSHRCVTSGAVVCRSRMKTTGPDEANIELPRGARRRTPRGIIPLEDSMVNLTVNGTNRSFDGDDDMPLLWYLRDELRLTGTRFGCGAGLCGACTVHVDGRAVRACQTQMRTVQSKRVTTIEGLSPNGTHPVQRAWETHDVAQCGYCQAGQIMQAAAMLQSTPKPTDADIDRVMAGNICRCGTYTRIRAAIKTAANGGRS